MNSHLLYFLTNHFVIFSIIGLTFTMLGIFLGKLLWQKSRKAAGDAEVENEKLLKHFRQMEADYERMSTEYAKIRNGGNETDWCS